MVFGYERRSRIWHRKLSVASDDFKHGATFHGTERQHGGASVPGCHVDPRNNHGLLSGSSREERCRCLGCIRGRSSGQLYAILRIWVLQWESVSQQCKLDAGHLLRRVLCVVNIQRTVHGPSWSNSHSVDVRLVVTRRWVITELWKSVGLYTVQSIQSCVLRLHVSRGLRCSNRAFANHGRCERHSHDRDWRKQWICECVRWSDYVHVKRWFLRVGHGTGHHE